MLDISNVISFMHACTQCDRERAVELFNMELVDNPNTVAVIGCGCSSVTEAVASASNGTIPVVSLEST